MLAVLSPAKKLDFNLPAEKLPLTAPPLIRQTAELMETARELTQADLKQLMKLSPQLARLNFDRFQAFASGGKPKGAKQAALAFNGDTYTGLMAWEFNADDFQFAQEHVAILSGLYGLLRPLDAIQPYRLEMGTKLTTPRGNNLYQFWGPRIADQINASLEGHEEPLLINLASTEYFTAVDRKALKYPILTCVFQELRGGKAKVIGLCAKRARGMMARYIVQNRITNRAGLASFQEGGYRLDESSGTEDSLVFTRAS